MVRGSGFRVLGSGSWFRVLILLCPLLVCPLPCARRLQPAPAFDSTRAYEHLRQIVSIGPRPAGSPGIAQTREYIIAQLKALGIPVTQQAFVAKTPIGEIPMVNLIATIPGARKERIAITGHYDTKLFREIPLRRRERRRVEHRVPHRARTGAEGARECVHDRADFLRRRRGDAEGLGRNRPHLRQPALRRRRRKAGTLSTLKALVLVDMIADRSPRFMRESNSTPWLTDIIWSTAQKLGHGSHLRQRKHADRGRPRPVSQRRRSGNRHHRPRLRRRGTPRPTRSTRPRREPCRLWVMWWSRRSRRSRLG